VHPLLFGKKGGQDGVASGESDELVADIAVLVRAELADAYFVELVEWREVDDDSIGLLDDEHGRVVEAYAPNISSSWLNGEKSMTIVSDCSTMSMVVLLRHMHQSTTRQPQKALPSASLGGRQSTSLRSCIQQGGKKNARCQCCRGTTSRTSPI